MTVRTIRESALSKGHKIALGMLMAALLLAWAHPALALVPLVLLLMLYLIAPFMYRFGFFLPVISRGRTGLPVVALTFDDGPDPITTPLLLERLAAHQAPATFFVTGRRAAAYPELIQAILAAGHTIGNHSFSHDSLVAFKGRRRIFTEIAETQRILREMGVTPMLFRPPVGITYPEIGRAHV
jgi:peptidoglycan/xylan/chitin deacetylase (PgdA/CDA1 family)